MIVDVKKLLNTRMTRTFAITKVEQTKADGTASDVYELSISSDTPYKRQGWYEVLSHADGAVNLDRIATGAPVLNEHDPKQFLGAIRKAWVDNGKLRAQIEFSNSPHNTLAQQVKDEIDQGVRNSISVGYNIDEFDAPKNRMTKEGLPVMTAMRWTPYETSVVTLPADTTVGFGRAATTDTAWSKPVLSDFTDKQWADLTASEKSKIGSHFMWAPKDATTFGDFKLPFKDKSGKVNLAAVRNILARLNQTQGIPAAEKAKIKTKCQNILAKSKGEKSMTPEPMPEVADVLADPITEPVLCPLCRGEMMITKADDSMGYECKACGVKFAVPTPEETEPDELEAKVLVKPQTALDNAVTDVDEEDDSVVDESKKVKPAPNVMGDDEEDTTNVGNSMGHADETEDIANLTEAETLLEEVLESEEEEEAEEAGDAGKSDTTPFVNAAKVKPQGTGKMKSQDAAKTAKANTTHISVRETAMKDTLKDVESVGAVDLSAKEKERYSVVRGILNQLDGKKGLEQEVSDALRPQMERCGLATTQNSFFIPTTMEITDVMNEKRNSEISMKMAGKRSMQRDFSFGDSNTGGAITQLTVLTTLIDFLRNVPTVARAGAEVLSLPGKVAYPRLKADLSANWIAEDGAGSSIGSASLDQVILSPKKMNFYTGYSLELLRIANLSIETLIRDNIYRAAATAFDKAVFQTVSNGPTGLDNLTGVVSGSFTSGSAISYAELTSCWAAVAKHNVLAVAGATPGFIMTPQIAQSCYSTPRFTGSAFLPIMQEDNEILGYPVFHSNNLYQAAGHRMYFGAWNNAILATFGPGIEIITDPYTQKHRGVVEIGANYLGDIQFKHPEAFAVIDGVLVS